MLRIPAEVASIPADTYRVATAVFPEGNLIMRIREAVGPLFETADFTSLFPRLGQPALDPARPVHRLEIRPGAPVGGSGVCCLGVERISHATPGGTGRAGAL